LNKIKRKAKGVEKMGKRLTKKEKALAKELDKKIYKLLPMG